MEKFKQLLERVPSLLKSVEERGYKAPTEIQEKSIPEILKGSDVIAGASTGSGKTLAFAAGLIKNIKKDFGVGGLVLTPTRELAEQVSNELLEFSKFRELNVIAVYGGVAIGPQIRRISYADIVVGTPGRILDHIQRNSIDLSQVNTLVLDEADRMLDMGFRDDVEKIILKCGKKRQTLLFSATISREITNLAKKYMKNMVEVSAKSQVDPKKLQQFYYDIDDKLKFSLLKHLLENEDSKLVMIFCSTRRNVDFISNNLKLMGIDAVGIHGGFSQEKRTKIITGFHSNNTHVLVATDIAARGLDIKGVSHVYNYDIPPNADDYTHRIGRTARAGKSGKIINILASRDYENFRILKNQGFLIKLEDTPEIERVFVKWTPDGQDGGKGGFSRGGGRGGSSRSGSGYSGGGRRDSRGGGGGYSRDSKGPRRDSRSDSRGGYNKGPRRDSRNDSQRDSRTSSRGDSRSSKPYFKNKDYRGDSSSSRPYNKYDNSNHRPSKSSRDSSKSNYSSKKRY